MLMWVGGLMSMWKTELDRGYRLLLLSVLLRQGFSQDLGLAASGVISVLAIHFYIYIVDRNPQ